MALQKRVPSGDKTAGSMKPLNISSKVHAGSQPVNREASHSVEPDVEIDLKEVYFLIMHFLSAGPCSRTCGQLWNELIEHNLLSRRYHAWYSRSGCHSRDENDDGSSFPLSYDKLAERYSHIEKDHLVKLLKQLLRSSASSSEGLTGTHIPSAADVPTLLGTGSFSLLNDMHRESNEVRCPPAYMRWPHKQADQVRGLSLREIGGGFSRHHRSPSIRAACYAVAKPSTMVQKMQNIKRVRGHRDAVYCAILDRSGRYVITGSDDRLVKIWSMETAFCLASCRGHEGDITDLAVSSSNALVASSSNDCNIRVWRLPDGLPISVLRGHTGAVTAIAFSPRPSAAYQLLSSSDDGTCRVWDARSSQVRPRIYVPRPSDSVAGRGGAPSSSASAQNHQIFCCAYNANGTVFVTGSSDTLARVWNASKTNKDESDQPIHEIDVLSGHENDVNYVQFSGCAVVSRICSTDPTKEENLTKFKNSWFSQDNIVTCSRDGSAIIWVPKSRRAHRKIGRWTRSYHLKVPPPPMPPQPPRGGPRQRILPTPRGVNMIIWSLDNRFVLAAIMDCRICVWNASDGGLVHSLTGHTDSTYVLDVHPFNPRIAMSAGYDGKTIVWDIWEGTPIRIYEISRFKLVDGKFSPDGTSIILSDDVGQLYILSTGQGESQKDAMYDQFFLGDYRPLVQDTYGNVLDQETQLAPYRRNMQDLLCDSAMTPYEEPYQSMYQRHRLGALGIEWRPSSLRLAVGPDFSLDPEYQLLPLADLDMPVDPLPEFIDVMDWEPAIDVQSDDNDSEYNVPEENSYGGQQGSLGSNSSEDFGYSDGDSETDESNKDGLRRSRRRKQKAEVEIMTSSGRRVKRRNLDEGDGEESSLKNNRTKKSRNGWTKKKSSKLKGLRPQRAAARNALNLFSRITGAPSDGEDEDSSDSNVSESDSAVEDSRIESDDSDRLLQNQKTKNSKGKEISYEEFGRVTERQELPDTSMNAENKKKLILRLPIRDSNRPVSLERSTHTLNKPGLEVGSSHEAPLESTEVEQNRQCSSTDTDRCRVVGKGKEHEGKVENVRNLTEGYINGKMKWGGVKARSYKRARWGEAASSNPVSESSSCFGLSDGIHSKSNGLLKLDKVSEESDGTRMDEMAQQDQKLIDDVMPDDLNNASISNGQEKLGVDDHEGYNKSLQVDMASGHRILLSPSGMNGQLNVVDDSSKPLLSGSNDLHASVLVDFENSVKPEAETLFNGNGDGVQNIEHEKPTGTEENEVSEAPDLGQIKRIKMDEGMRESDVDRNGCSTSYSSHNVHLHATKTYTAVYRRSKSSKSRKIILDEGKTLGEQTSSMNNHDTGADEDFHEGLPDVDHGKRLMGPEQSSFDAEYVNKQSSFAAEYVNNNLELEQGHEPEETLPVSQNHSINRHGFPQEDWGSCSKLTVGVRSTRNRRASCHLRETSPVNKKRPNQSSRKGSWLLLTSHEEGSRYIPQQGDDVVYLRQGHEEYMQYSLSKESGPWRSLKGKIRAVEFCRVEGLEYSISPGSGESCCKLTLEFTDSTSCLLGKSFKLTLPEVTNFPDFLVEKTRYDAAIKRNWTFRDKCRVWWKNEGEEDGSWWEGRILALKPKSPDFPDSPWERFTIKYKSDPTETHLHSPWELFDEDTQWEEPCIDDDVRNSLLSSIDKLERSGGNQDRYGIQKLKQASQKPSFINRFAVPISLEVIQARLENNYYRSIEALRHDIMVMLSNAETQFGRSPELSAKLKRLSDWFKRILNSL